MRRSVVLLSVATLLLTFTPSARAAVTGEVCQTRHRNGHHVQVCTGVDAESGFGAKGFAMNGNRLGVRVEVDYLILWVHAWFPDDYYVETRSDDNFVIPRGTTWGYYTPWDIDAVCSGSHMHTRLYTELRYRIGPRRDPGPWHVIHSQEAECQY